MNIPIIHEVTHGNPDEWALCFQWVRYNFDDQPPRPGYRFIWRDEQGRLQPERGQARIPSAAELFLLIQLATEAGWFITCERETTSSQF